MATKFHEASRGEQWHVSRPCPECATKVVWVADVAPQRDLLALHRQLCHGERAQDS